MLKYVQSHNTGIAWQFMFDIKEDLVQDFYEFVLSE